MSKLSDLDGQEIPVQSVYCIGRNVFAHVVELGNQPPSEPLIFLKSRAAVRPLDVSGVAFPDETYHHEAEVVVVVGSPVPFGAEVGWEVVRGVALGLDLTRRGVQAELKRAGLPWTRSKSFLGSAPIGPVIPMDRLGDPDRLCFWLEVEGERRQSGALSQLTFDIPSLLTTLARFQPLVPGDLVFTGTPAGVGPIQQGQRFTLGLESPALRFDGVL